MRVLAALGAALFAYLAVIPAAVVGAAIDPACAGSSCEYSPSLTVYLVIAFGATALALAASALAMAVLATRPSPWSQGLVRTALKVSAACTGVLLLSELALPHPVAALVIVGACVPFALIGSARRNAANRARPPGAGTHRAPG